MQILPRTFAALYCPDETRTTSRLRFPIAACDPEDGIGFRSIYLTELNCFTPSHCGSCAPLPTLKPHFAAMAPRLSTGCSLRFAGFGLSLNYIIYTELARPPMIFYITVRHLVLQKILNGLCKDAAGTVQPLVLNEP